MREKFKNEKKGSKTRSEKKNSKKEEREKRNNGRKKKETRNKGRRDVEVKLGKSEKKEEKSNSDDFPRKMQIPPEH